MRPVAVSCPLSGCVLGCIARSDRQGGLSPRLRLPLYGQCAIDAQCDQAGHCKGYAQDGGAGDQSVVPHGSADGGAQNRRRTLLDHTRITGTPCAWSLTPQRLHARAYECVFARCHCTVRIRAGTTCRVERQVNSEADAMSFGFAYSKLALETITIKMAHQYEPQRIRFNGWWAFLFLCAAVLTEVCLCGACSGHEN